VSYYSNSARQKDIPRCSQPCIHLDTYRIAAKLRELRVAGTRLGRKGRKRQKFIEELERHN